MVQWPACPPNKSNPFNWNGPGYQAVLKIMFRATDVAYPRVQVGDRIQFNAQGPIYRSFRTLTMPPAAATTRGRGTSQPMPKALSQLNPSESNFSNGYIATTVLRRSSFSCLGRGATVSNGELFQSHSTTSAPRGRWRRRIPIRCR